MAKKQFHRGSIKIVQVKRGEGHQGSGNHVSDETKENARLKRELQDAKNALEVLKKQSASWESGVLQIPGTPEAVTEASGKGNSGKTHPLWRKNRSIESSDRGAQ